MFSSDSALRLVLPDEQAQLALGAQIAAHLPETLVLYLDGDLGTGKTTLTRGLLRALGHRGAVRSPTYTLIESYALGARRLHHFDLYRLGDPEELEYLGLRDLLAEPAIWIVEWPERGHGALPEADLYIQLRHLDTGRALCLAPRSAAGQALIARLGLCDTIVSSVRQGFESH
ncbi:MAG: tRNA (adenosine(37)-N6)-threonylcarbamoyltransferase complex ATPase subunit type 1 TsaE [Chromatiaceae bacterium]|nr:tRNA (adenosine(37)-N6)-threonylcarbamoyltransferase complex ATPase subunit type 1 TsaE [Chromatiaceae bacterium]